MPQIIDAFSFLLNSSLYLSILCGFRTSNLNIHNSIIQIKNDFALDTGGDEDAGDDESVGALDSCNVGGSDGDEVEACLDDISSIFSLNQSI